MFRQSLFESVKARLLHPQLDALPLHARIQRAIRQLILDGALAPGNPLPASRALAQSLGVSRDTVEAAYSRLHAEGFIERRVGSGSVVAAATRLSPGRRGAGAPRRVGGAPRLSRRGEAMQAGGGVREQLVPRPFAPGVPETRTFPLATWERLQRQVLKEYGARALIHGDPQGAEPLRQAIADYVNLERGARATADRVLVLTSSQQALGLCASVLLDAGERIFVEDPAYYGARKAFEAAGLECLPVPVDEQGLRPEPILAQPQAARALCLTPSHHYPTGVTLSLERRLALIEWAQRQQAWIIEDDYDSEFHYAGRPTACVQGLDTHERTLYIGTFTKSLFPGLRIGYMVLPPALVAPMTVARSLQDGHNASLAQLTLARFIAGGHFGAYVRGMRNLYGERLGFLAERVGKRLGGLVEPRVPAGGLQMPGLLCAEIDETRAIAAAYRAGVELVGLSALHLAAPPRAGFLMGFAAYTTDELEAAVGVLAKTLRGLRANP
ncbi:PLP-dependent aminotransferase family protein [Pseudomonas aeruginosa]|uniref:MocR-like pyridoxine biosynthesis transcription factor PdxR n=1 Tax=Pseudomonas aeruginosa TaxID=287 RepID=UPI000F89CC25|nr:PLP-dependent aminotransferase family protein [Pseudomonas aeruginosa]EKV4570108.1 PLP-dependent aminotransferase family protein [Pseudomonas aeruginosa]MCV4360117.1 PLP-dependent aminotransferase family protein [Pseudomonas aeruginosa]MCW3882335.1 PLP-dependent aminotransferase family protein [Pseudomonas aeruginosa]RUA98096.1 PLP-dependent aminotransferase family protein [Pseudomonas aeruginosa]HBO5502236.1 PLP-dependent aminotransferase family protein [Pseudomonas aeruginosa]